METNYENVKKDVLNYLNITEKEFFNIITKDFKPSFPLIKTEENLNNYYINTNNSTDAIAIYSKEISFTENLNRFEKLNESFKRNRVKNILDFGCGTGFLTTFFIENNYDVTYTDYQTRMLDFVQYRNKNKGIKQDLLTFNYNQIFDAVMCIHVLEHVLNPEMVLNKLMNMVHEEGLLVLDYPFTWNEPEINPEHLGQDDFRLKISSILRQNGFIQLNVYPFIWQKKTVNKNGQVVLIKKNYDGSWSFKSNMDKSQSNELIGLLQRCIYNILQDKAEFKEVEL